MKSKTTEILQKLLASAKQNVPKRYIAQYVAAHPHPDSVECITDFLDLLSINNLAAEVERESLTALPTPFLAHTKDGDGNFGLKLVTNPQKLVSKDRAFLAKWTGHIVAADFQKGFSPNVPEHFQQNERTEKWMQAALYLVLLGIILYGIPRLLTSQQPVLAILIALGTVITCALFIQSVSGRNKITDHICSVFKTNSCMELNRSKYSHFLPGLTMADMALTYFLINIILIVPTGIPLDSLVLSIVFGAAFCVFSIVRQIAERKFCILCLAIVLVVCCQFVYVLLYNLFSFEKLMEPVNIIRTATISAFSLFLTLFYKSYFNHKKLADNNGTQLLKFQSNGDLLINHLFRQHPIPFDPFDRDLFYGEKDAPIQLLMACSPFCQPCAMVHRLIHGLMANKNAPIGVTIRFLVNDTDSTEYNTTVSYILSIIYAQYSKMEQGQRGDFVEKIIGDWYTIGDFESFKNKYPLDKEVNIHTEIQELMDWSHTNQITHTPTIYINGHCLKGPYSFFELPFIVQILSKHYDRQLTIHNT